MSWLPSWSTGVKGRQSPNQTPLLLSGGVTMCSWVTWIVIFGFLFAPSQSLVPSYLPVCRCLPLPMLVSAVSSLAVPGHISSSPGTLATCHLQCWTSVSPECSLILCTDWGLSLGDPTGGKQGFHLMSGHVSSGKIHTMNTWIFSIQLGLFWWLSVRPFNQMKGTLDHKERPVLPDSSHLFIVNYWSDFFHPKWLLTLALHTIELFSMLPSVSTSLFQLFPLPPLPSNPHLPYLKYKLCVFVSFSQ